MSNATRRTDKNGADEEDFVDEECVSRRGDNLRNGNGVIEGRDGGSDGGDGEGDEAGAGRGLDVTTFTFNAWQLSPGEAGVGYNSSYQSGTTYSYTRLYGGGAAGVLVNGAGPDGTTTYEGKGYGGGRGVNGNGGAGVILIEVATI